MRPHDATISGVGDDKDRKKQAKAEWKAQKMRHEADKKSAKADAKIAKKRMEAGLPPEAPAARPVRSTGSLPEEASPGGS